MIGSMTKVKGNSPLFLMVVLMMAFGPDRGTACVPTLISGSEGIAESSASADTMWLSQASARVDSLLRLHDPAAEDLARRALSMAIPFAGTKWQAHAERDLGAALRATGEHEKALRHFASAMQRYDALGMTHHAAECMERMAVLNIILGRFDRAEELLLDAMTPRWTAENDVLRATCAYDLGYLAAERGELDAAMAHFSKSEVIAVRSGAFHAQALAFHGQAIVHCKRKELEKGIDCYERMIELSDSIGADQLKAQGVAGRAGIVEELGRKDEALGLYEAALVLTTAVGDAPWSAFLHANIARLCVDRKDMVKAEAHALEGLTMAKTCGAVRDVPALYKALYQVNEAAGRTSKALDYMRKYAAAQSSLAEDMGLVSEVSYTTQLVISEQVFADSIARTHSHYSGLLETERSAARTYRVWTWLLAGLSALLVLFVLNRRK